MKDKWEKGDPVNLSDLLKITPVANEIIRLSGELNMKCADIIWIAAEIIKDCEYHDARSQGGDGLGFDTDEDMEFNDEDWEHDEEDSMDSYYRVQMKINSKGKFPEVAFKAGMNDKEDVKKFLTMVSEIMEKMDI